MALDKRTPSMPRKSMIRVAITGGPGAGKSMVLSFFERLGSEAVDLDALSREVTEPGSPAFRQIVAAFGDEVVASDGTLNRRKLRKTIFEDTRSKIVLESITHPAILDLLEKKLMEIAFRSEYAMVVVEVPLLVEAALQSRFDVVVLVDAKPEVRKSRIMERDHCTAPEAEALMGLHLSTEEKKAHAHYMVDNSGDINDTKLCVGRIFYKILKDVSKTLTA